MSKYIESHGIEAELYEPMQGIINIVANIGSGKPHLVLNGHPNQFIGEINEKCMNPPHSGLIKDGKIHGRGSGEIKGGLASLLCARGFQFSIISAIIFKRLIDVIHEVLEVY